MTTESGVSVLRQPDTVDDPLTAVFREGVQRLLAEAIEAEAEVFSQSMRAERVADNRARLVRRRHGPEWPIRTGIGGVCTAPGS